MNVTHAADASQDEFHRSIGAILDAYAWFDFNVGLKIKYWARAGDAATAVLRRDVPFSQRLRFLKGLVETSRGRVTAKQQSTWQQWLDNVEAIRALRNDYAHGRWVRLYDDNKATLVWRFAPLDWSSDQGQRSPVEVTAAELAHQAAQIRRALAMMDEVIAPFLD